MSAMIAPRPLTMTISSLRTLATPQRASKDPTMNMITPAKAAHPESVVGPEREL